MSIFKKLGIDLDDKKKSIILIVAIALTTIFICSNIIKSRVKKRYNLTQKIKDQSQRIALRTDIEKIEKIQQGYAKYFYDNIDQQTLRSIISDLAKETGVNIISIKTLNREQIGSLSKELLEMSLRCTYNQLGVFTAKIEDLKNITKIESLLIEGISDFASQIMLSAQAQKTPMELDLQVSVSMVIAGYSVGD